MELFVSLGLGIDFIVVEPEENINLHEELANVRIDEVVCHCLLVEHQCVNLLDVDGSQDSYLWIQLKRVISAGVAGLPAMAEPPHNLVH